MMGGEVGVISEEGRGSEFWFTVRLSIQPESAQALPAPTRELSGVKVLIVDDNATNRDILTAQLSGWGMRPTVTSNGPSGLETLYTALDEKDPFQIAVIDMQMPGMDGETLGRAIRADNRLAETRLVMMTSLGIRGDARRFAEIGFAAYLTKPARSRELKSVLSAALSDRVDKPPILTRHSTRNLQGLFVDRKVRILLAEDNITNQQVALGFLRKFGLHADAVANGAEVLKAMETLSYDLILMDIQMPIMDGLETTRRIRDHEKNEKNEKKMIPIVAMTAHAMGGDRKNVWPRA